MSLSNVSLVAFHYRPYGTFFLYSKKLHNFHGGFTHYRNYRAKIYFYVSENISISVLAFFIFRRKIMQKNEQSSRQIVMCHLMAIMGIDIEKGTWIVGEMEESGLIQFDDMGNVGLLVLEGQS